MMDFPLTPTARLYRILLRCLLPRAFHDRYAHQMLDVFSAVDADQRATRGVGAAWHALAAELPGLLALAAQERRQRRATPRGAGHDRRRIPPLSTLVRDVRLAARSLRRSPGFTLAVVLTLALGLGGNIAVFGVVDAALLRPLPYPDAGRIVRVFERHPTGLAVMSPPNFVDVRAQAQGFAAMAAYYEGPRTLTGFGDPQPIPAAMVTGDFFAAFGLMPALGRPFAPEELRVGQTGVAVIGDGLWHRQFGADPRVLGRTIQLDGKAVTIVGVMPPGFDYPSGAQLWTPLAFTEHDMATQRGAHYLDVVGRLTSGTSLARANESVATVAARLASAYPKTNAGYGAAVVPLRDALVGPTPRRALLVLLGAVALVVLIACANVANLLLARGARRQRDLAIRTALGASPSAVVRLAMVESLTLAVLGGAVALVLAAVAARGLDSLRPDELRQLGDVRLDVRVLGFTIALSLGAGFLFGLVPAVQAARAGALQRALVGGGRGDSVSREGWRLRGGLMAAELALAVMLLAGAALLVRSFQRLIDVSPGFDPHGVLTAYLSLPDARYPRPDDADQLYRQLLQQVSALPGVRSAAAASALPLDQTSFSITTVSIDGVPIPDERQPSTQIRLVTPDFFRTLRVPLAAGRAFTTADRADAPHVIVVNRAAARLLWPGKDPIGHTAIIGTSFGVGRGRAGGEVVGVVDDVHDDALGTPSRPTIYIAHAQFPVTDMALAVRVAPGLDPLSLAPVLRRQVRQLDPNLPLVAVRTMDQVARLSIAQQRFAMTLLALFAAIAVALAAVGIYGVVAYVVGQRTHEIGIRMALGASGRVVVKQVLRGAAAPVVAGVGLGVLGALVVTRAMTRLLFEIRPGDPATLVLVVSCLVAVAALAAYVPARRASRVDPLLALRAE